MKKLLAITIMAALLLAVPGTALASGTPLERTIQAGWSCADIAGAMHCFDPGDMSSNNGATINVKVYAYDGSFLGTEQLWLVNTYSGQPCPQSELLDLGFAFACHHYSQ